MKNSHRSDRQLAHKLGVAQPTVSRVRSRLEKEGYIMEYTMIPNLQKLGYHLIAFTLAKINAKALSDDVKKFGFPNIEEAHKKAPPEVVFFGTGIGEDYSVISVSHHRNYAEYCNFRDVLKKHPCVDQSSIMSFIEDLNADSCFRYLTFSTLAEHLLMKRVDGKKSSRE